MSLPPMFRDGSSRRTPRRAIYTPQKTDIVQHEWVYSAQHGAQQSPLVKSFLQTFPEKQIHLYPLIDWHCKHRSLQLDGQDVFLCEVPDAADSNCVRVPVHGAAPQEDWLQASAPLWVVKMGSTFYFLDREKLKESGHEREGCPFFSSAVYMLVPLDSAVIVSAARVHCSH